MLLSGVCVFGQQRMNAEEYIRLYKDAAIADMRKTGVPASITLAQGMYESDFGNSPLARNANNHFGIKCHNEWTGPSYHQDDDAAHECFRVYNAVQESYDDHSNFLKSRERYRSLFSLEITDYKGWAHGLKKAGYATNPHYASKLIDLIERYNLCEVDKACLNNTPALASTVPGIVTENVTDPKPVVKEGTLNFKSPVITAPSGSINDVPYVKAKKGDSWLRIANANNVELWQLLEFNEVEKNSVLRENDIVYLKAKKTRNDETSFHVVQKGETIYRISQLYGVRVKKLYSRNHLKPGQEPEPGSRIYLKMNKSFYE